MVIFLLVLWRIALFSAAYGAQHIIPYLGFFPYKEILGDYHLPTWISAFANFDGIHYMLIAQQGYSEYEQAFFPFYPFVMHVVNFIFHNYLISGLFVSNISFAFGVSYLQKVWNMWFPKQKHFFVWVVLMITAYPFAFFFGSVYTEGLFFLLTVLSLYFLEKRSYRWAAVFGALASLTRLIGVFLFLPFAFHFIERAHAPSYKKWFPVIQKNISIILSPWLGFITYAGYLLYTTGDALFFLHAQPAFGAHRSSTLVVLPQVYYRYLKILFTASHDFQWGMSIVEMSVFSLVGVILLVDLIWRVRAKHYDTLLGLAFFSLINLILPTFTGTFSSMGRYVLFSFSFFIFLARIPSNAIRVTIIILFTLAHLVLMGFFIQGYFVG